MDFVGSTVRNESRGGDNLRRTNFDYAGGVTTANYYISRDNISLLTLKIVVNYYCQFGQSRLYYRHATAYWRWFQQQFQRHDSARHDSARQWQRAPVAEPKCQRAPLNTVQSTERYCRSADVSRASGGKPGNVSHWKDIHLLSCWLLCSMIIRHLGLCNSTHLLILQ